MATASDTSSINKQWQFAAPEHYVCVQENGEHSLHLLVDGLKCAGCMRKIERRLSDFQALTDAHVNLTTHRLVMRWKDANFRPEGAINAVLELGFGLAPFDPETFDTQTTRENRRLMIAMSVAGFAMANVMMLSFAQWLGANDDATRLLFQWVSALIALPTIAFSGRVFFSSAFAALRSGGLNMDVPISLAIILAAAMSVFEISTGGEHAYFDASVSLLFFLLVGRYLDHNARGHANAMGAKLVGLQASSATVRYEDGKQERLPLHLVSTGMTILVAQGEKVPADGYLIDPQATVDNSLMTGETVWVELKKGEMLFAGSINRGAPFIFQVSAVGEDTKVGEMARLLEAAQQGRGRYVRIADRIAYYYAPVVHLLGLFTFLAWWLVLGAEWQDALLTAIAVLIITCPCALGLAVPVVQVIASGRLLRQGILLKSADALERLKGADTIVFDKTGTLTTGQLIVENEAEIPRDLLLLASGICANSNHPLAQALRKLDPHAPAIEGVEETAGRGLSLNTAAGRVKIGSRSFCDISNAPEAVGPELWITRPNNPPQCVKFRDHIREDAFSVLSRLKQDRRAIVLLSGDQSSVVTRAATALNIDYALAEQSPQDKADWIQNEKEQGRHVIMVGDGLNDALALTTADASLSPSTGSDLSQNSADVVFQGANLYPVFETLSVAERTHALVTQNFALAFGYNLIAIPIAVMGYATPLVAAIAMSSSSLLVILNALRLARS